LPIFAWVHAAEETTTPAADSEWPWALVRSREETQRRNAPAPGLSPPSAHQTSTPTEPARARPPAAPTT
jgi:hypothetical protein